MVAGGEKKSHGSDCTVQDGTRLVIGSIGDRVSSNAVSVSATLILTTLVRAVIPL